MKNIETIKKPEVLEQFWNSIEPEVKAFYANILEKNRYMYEPDEFKEELEKKIENEKYFVSEVYNNILNACQENNQEVILLLDVDNTIGVPTYDHDKESYKIIGTTLRPSIVPLLSKIKQEFSNAKTGLLSTRSKEWLQNQLKDSKELKLIENYIDPELVFSTDELEDEEFDRFFKTKDYEDYLKNHPLIGKEVNENEVYNFDSQDWVKLERLKQIHKNNPSVSIVSVDDAVFPRYLNHGVSLHEAGEGGFWI